MLPRRMPIALGRPVMIRLWVIKVSVGEAFVCFAAFAVSIMIMFGLHVMDMISSLLIPVCILPFFGGILLFHWLRQGKHDGYLFEFRLRHWWLRWTIPSRGVAYFPRRTVLSSRSGYGQRTFGVGRGNAPAVAKAMKSRQFDDVLERRMVSRRSTAPRCAPISLAEQMETAFGAAAKS